MVQTYVSAWRKVLDGAGHTSAGGRRLETVGAGYRLDLEGDECDVFTFRDLLFQGRRAADQGSPDEAARHFRAALYVWRGPALADLSRQPSHGAVTRELEAARLGAVEGWATAALRSAGDVAQIAEVATALDGGAVPRTLAGDPHRAADVGLTAAGQPGGRARCLHRDPAPAGDELGADPGPALAAMHERVLRADPTLQVRPQPVGDRGARTDAPRAIRPRLVRRPRPGHAQSQRCSPATGWSP